MTFKLLSLFCALFVHQSISVSISSSASSFSSSPCLIYCPGGYKVEYQNCSCILDPSITPSYIWNSTRPSCGAIIYTPSGSKSCSIYCPYFFKIDYRNCTCILDTNYTTHCDLFCPSGFIADYSKCQCNLMSSTANPCMISCHTGYLSDYERCECILDPTSSTTGEPSCLIAQLENTLILPNVIAVKLVFVFQIQIIVHQYVRSLNLVQY